MATQADWFQWLPSGAHAKVVPNSALLGVSVKWHPSSGFGHCVLVDQAGVLDVSGNETDQLGVLDFAVRVDLVVI